ncbi:MAG TPA: lactate utilization protein C [Burkholderiales bacterium]|nr:lactate utilization protein C [Burkholderiales bacterium]
MSLGSSDSARRSILARIRKAQGRWGASPDAEIAGLQRYLDARSRGPRRPIEGDLLVRFRAGAESMQCTVVEVGAPASVPRTAAESLRSLQLPLSGCMTDDLASLDWNAAGLNLQARPAVDADAVGVTSCFAAIAETGTLMLVSGPGRPGSVSLLPETHIAVVNRSRIVPYMEDAWDLLRKELGEPPRAVSFISGPSRTGDIEQTIVLGAHGPYRVQIIVVNDA